MNNNIQDPREQGTQGIKGLKGVSSPDVIRDYLASQDIPFTVDNLIKFNNLLLDNESLIGHYTTADLPELGTSKLDKNITNTLQLANLQEFRAQEQSGVEQLLHGLGKAVGLAGTTFVDGVVGSLFGVGEAIAYMAMDEDTKEEYKKATGNDNAFEAFWHNNLSRELSHLNDNLEKLLPNYYTQYELDNPFRLNANTIGDKFLKNIGFLVGAMGSGRIGGKALGNLLQIDKTRKAFKGATVLGKNADELTNTQLVNLIKSGADNGSIVDDVLIKNAKKLKNQDLTTKIFGSVTAAGGEARMEANMNIDQYYNLDLNNLKNAYEEASEGVEAQLFREHPEWFGLQQTGDGRIINTLIDPKGIAEYQRRQEALKSKYEEGLKVLQDEATSMGNRIFLTDFALLSLTNLGTFGRFLGGGYSAGRLAQNNAIKGSLRGAIEANKKGFISNAARVLKAPVTEGVVEEMMQESINKAAGYKASSHLNEFWGSKVNPDAEDKAISFMDAMAKGMAETYGSAEGWEIGTIAALSSIVGLPRFKHITTTDPNTGKKKLSNVTEWFNGEFWEEIKDIKKEKELTKKYVTQANENSDNRIQTLWDHAVRGIALSDKAEKAAKNGDKFEYLNAESASIANDVILYSRLGMYQELVDFAEQAENITEDDVELIKELTSDKDGKGFYADKSDEEILKDIKERAAKYKATIERMHDTSESLKVLYGEDISDEALLALTYGFSVIDNTTNRIKELLQDEDVKSFIKETEKKVNETNREIRAKNVKAEEKDKLPLVEQMQPYELLEEGTKAVEDFLNNENPETLSKWLNKILRNPEVVKQVFTEENHVNPAILQNTAFRKLLDLNQLIAFRDSVIDEYNEVANNPGLFTDEGIALQNDIINKHNKKKAKDIVENWKKEKKEIASYNDLVNILTDNSSYEEYILDSIENSGTETEKSIVKGYKEVRSRAKVLSDTIKNTLSSLSEDESELFGFLEVLAENIVSGESVTDGDTFDKAVEDILNNAIPEDTTIVSEETTKRIKEVLTKVKEDYIQNLSAHKELSTKVEAPKKSKLAETVSKTVEAGKKAVNTIKEKVTEKKEEKEEKETKKKEESLSTGNNFLNDVREGDTKKETAGGGTIEGKIESSETTNVETQSTQDNQKSSNITSIPLFKYVPSSKSVDAAPINTEVSQVLNRYGAQAFLDSKVFYSLNKEDLKFKIIKIGDHYYIGLKLTGTGKTANNETFKDSKNDEYQLVQAVTIDKANTPKDKDVENEGYIIYNDEVEVDKITEGFFQAVPNEGQVYLTEEMIKEAYDKVYLGIFKDGRVYYGASDDFESSIEVKGDASKNGHIFLVVPTINGYRARAAQTVTIKELWESATQKEKDAVFNGTEGVSTKADFLINFKNKLIDYLRNSNTDNWSDYKDALKDFIITDNLKKVPIKEDLSDNDLFEEFMSEESMSGMQLSTTGINSTTASQKKLDQLVEMGAIKVNVTTLNNVGVMLIFKVPSITTTTTTPSTPINPTKEIVEEATGAQVETNKTIPVFKGNPRLLTTSHIKALGLTGILGMDNLSWKTLKQKIGTEDFKNFVETTYKEKAENILNSLNNINSIPEFYNIMSNAKDC